MSDTPRTDIVRAKFPLEGREAIELADALERENAKLREVRAAVLKYERITDTSYALVCNDGDFTTEFTALLRALHATMRPNDRQN
jgi:hypothetical protein